MQNVAERQSLIATARGDFLRFGETQPEAVTEAVTDVVAASWRRSMSAGVDAAKSQADYHDDLDTSGRLARCSAAVIVRLSEEMADLPLSIVLSDSKARILSRLETDVTIGRLLDTVLLAPGFNYAEGSVGTNGIGTVFESGQPLYIVGSEHFHEQLQPFACAATPIRDPLTGRVEGVLDISCLVEDSSPLMIGLVRSTARDIERNLLADRTLSQQALFEAFMRFGARTRGAVVAVGSTVAMSNAVARALFEPSEQWSIKEHARYLMAGRGKPDDTICLSSGRMVRLRGSRVVTGTDVAGIVVGVTILSESVPAFGASTLDARATTVQLASTIAPAAVGNAISVRSEGRSPLWRRACNEVVAALDGSRGLLVMGETGCGKLSLVDELYHRLLPNGRTMVFDAAEIGEVELSAAELELSTTIDPTLYIFRKVDTLDADRLIALTAFLVALTSSGQPVSFAATVSDANANDHLVFQQLLTHFGSAVTIPPLRQRTEDLPDLVRRVLTTVSGRQGVTVSPSALRVISGFGWPGNIRQLEGALKSAVIKRPVGEIQVEDLPAYCHGGAERPLTALEAIERDMIVAALHAEDGNRVRAAAVLGIARSSLYRKLQGFGISIT